jgi:hypothetical protein
MKHSSGSLGVLALVSALAAAPLAAQAQVVHDATDNLWYEAVYTGPDGTTWNQAATQAVAMGGFLAAPTDQSQDDFVYSLVTDPKYWTGLSINSDRLGPWLGIYSTTDNGENFVYSGSGDALGSFHPWGPNQPDDYGGSFQAVGFYAFASEGSTWGDTPEDGVAGFPFPTGFVVQFDTSPVPEASESAMLKSGLVAALAMLWAKRRRSSSAPAGGIRPTS